MTSSQLPGKVVGSEPRPRVLLAWSGNDVDDVEAAIRRHAPTVRRIDDFYRIRQHDYDVLITNRLGDLFPCREFGDGGGAGAGMFVLWFSSGAPNEADRWGVSLSQQRVLRQTGGPSQSLVIPLDLPGEIDELVHDSLAPFCLGRHFHEEFKASVERTVRGELARSMAVSQARRVQEVDPPVVAPLILTPDRAILGCLYNRSPQSGGIALPQGTPRTDLWVKVAFRYWSTNYGTLPLVGGWWEQEEWQTTSESAAAVHLAEVGARLATTTSQLQLELERAASRYKHAQRDAARGPRRLLEAKGDELTTTVTAALGSLGYDVHNLDSTPTDDPAGKSEDLRLSDPDDSNVDPIIEVKGYDRGAKASDLAKIVRHLVRAHAAGRRPTALWWIVNHWRATPPCERQVLFTAEQAMLDEHGASDPPLVVIDTRDLFRALVAVESGASEASKVRASLSRGAGRWEGF